MNILFSEIEKTCRKCSNLFSGKYCKKCKKIYHEANVIRINARSTEWRLANPARAKALVAASHAIHADERKARKAAIYAANPAKAKAQAAVWAANNPDRKKSTSAAWAANNSDRSKATSAAWQAANPGMVRIISHNYRARKRLNGGQLSTGLSSRLFKLQKGKCACCGKSLDGGYHLDHIIPLYRGGLNIDGNMQLLTAICNMQKGAKDPIDFMQERGFLL
jgi:hypothetical protein